MILWVRHLIVLSVRPPGQIYKKHSDYWPLIVWLKEELKEDHTRFPASWQQHMFMLTICLQTFKQWQHGNANQNRCSLRSGRNGEGEGGGGREKVREERGLSIFLASPPPLPRTLRLRNKYRLPRDYSNSLKLYHDEAELSRNLIGGNDVWDKKENDIFIVVYSQICFSEVIQYAAPDTGWCTGEAN